MFDCVPSFSYHENSLSSCNIFVKQNLKPVQYMYVPASNS